METKDGDFGVFIYNEDDECIFKEYFAGKIQAMRYASQWASSLDKGDYLEVWRKENGYWGASGEPIFKSDAADSEGHTEQLNDFMMGL